MRRTVLIVAGVVVVAAAATLAIVLTRGSSPAAAAEMPTKGSAKGSSADAGELKVPLARFGVDLLAREAALTDGNVVVSPASLHAVLAMLLNGADGETAAEMRRALAVDGLDQAAVNQGWADIIVTAQSGKQPEVKIANSLWLRDGVPFKQPFLDLNRDYFAAGTLPLPGDPTEAADQINAWVEKNTAGKITQLVTPQSFTPDSLLALVNTIHLKVKWKHFDKELTQQEPFNLAGGGNVDVPMMHTHLETRAASTELCDAVRLSTSGPVDFWLIVPKGDETPETVLAAFAGGSAGAAAAGSGVAAVETPPPADADAPATTGGGTGLSDLFDQAQTTEGDLAMPRLDLSYTAQDLKGDLEAAGMTRAFIPDQAEFPGIADVDPLFVETIVQKAILEVNEEGVEAAAATGAIVGTTAMPVSGFDVRADRPYLVVLTENRSDATLFMALVRDPSQKGE
jgi:serine protease inhibitor